MKLNRTTVELVSEIEYIIGSECYNPNSYDGYTGDEGRDFRYPVTISKLNHNNELIERKVRGKIHENFYYEYFKFKPEDLKHSKYKFGSNHLYVCQGILQN